MATLESGAFCRFQEEVALEARMHGIGQVISQEGFPHFICFQVTAPLTQVLAQPVLVVFKSIHKSLEEYECQLRMPPTQHDASSFDFCGLSVCDF